MRTGLDFKSVQFDRVRGEAEDCIKMQGNLVQSGIGGFEMTSHTNKKIFSVRGINFAPVLGLDQYILHQVSSIILLANLLMKYL